MVNGSEDRLVASCTLSIKHFVEAVRPSRYATDDVRGGELLEAESKLTKSWADFEALSEVAWSSVREQISRTDEMYLWYYAARMAELAVRRNDESFVRYGLMALVVDDKFLDQRDIFTALALLLDAAKRIEADVESVFRNVAKRASAKRRDTIETYVTERCGEPSMDEVLAGIGYTVSGTGENFSYRSTVSP
jgi:hypothetical protein